MAKLETAESTTRPINAASATGVSTYGRTIDSSREWIPVSSKVRRLQLLESPVIPQHTRQGYLHRPRLSSAAVHNAYPRATGTSNQTDRPRHAHVSDMPVIVSYKNEDGRADRTKNKVVASFRQNGSRAAWAREYRPELDRQPYASLKTTVMSGGHGKISYYIEQIEYL
jgi:hypothetical protein